MPTDLDLANEACGLIGQDTVPSLLTSLNNKTVVAINQALPNVKESAIRARDWNCTRRRAALAAVTNESLGEWLYAYQTPADCLAVRRFVNERRFERSPFSWEVGTDGKRILYCNVEGAKIVYSGNITDVNRWDRLLYRACVGLLAAKLAASFGRDVKLAQMFLADAFREFDEAVGVDEGEGDREQESSTVFVDVRYGGTSGEGPTNVNR